MSTPNEGPAPQRTAQEQRAADIFNSLSDSQRVAMMRAIRTHEILAPVHTAIERSVAYTEASINDLRDYGQHLATGARMVRADLAERATAAKGAVTQFRDNTARRAGTARTNVASRADALSASVAKLVKDARDGVTGGVKWTKTTAAAVAAGAVDKANAGKTMVTDGIAAGQKAVASGIATGQKAVNDGIAAGQKAVASGIATGREAVGKAGRWFNEQISNAAAKASATFAGIAERRMDPALRGPDLSLPDNLRVNQHLTEIASAQTPEQLNTAMGNLSTFANERLSQMGGAQAGVAEAKNAARVAFSGVGERAGEPRAQATTGQAQADQGAAARPNLTKAEPKGPKIGG